MLNRALFASLPDLPFLITVWVGPVIASTILEHTSWRWGYGIWAVLLPVAFLPLAFALLLNQRKAKKLRLFEPKPRKGHGFIEAMRGTWYELDLFGLLLLSGAVTLILIPLTLASNMTGRWHNASIIAMIAVGCACLAIYPIWESSKRLAPRPLLSLHLLRQRTALAGCTLAFFYFSKPRPHPELPCDLMKTSGILLFRSALPVFLLTGCPRSICRHCRSRDANFRLHINDICSRSVILHQIRSKIPRLRHWRMLHLHSRPSSHATLSQGRK